MRIVQRDETIACKHSEIVYRQNEDRPAHAGDSGLKALEVRQAPERLDSAQASLIDEAVDADIAAIELELQTLAPAPTTQASPCLQPKGATLPLELPRIEKYHEPESTTRTAAGCGCTLKRIGEDVSEKLDYTPSLFTAERHIRSKWACSKCQTLMQAPVPAQIIDKGIPTAGLLA